MTVLYNATFYSANFAPFIISMNQLNEEHIDSVQQTIQFSKKISRSRMGPIRINTHGLDVMYHSN